MTGGELVARTLKGAGVGHVFTLCGGHILPIYDGCLGEAITLVDVRHEQAAAAEREHMAHARPLERPRDQLPARHSVGGGGALRTSPAVIASASEIYRLASAGGDSITDSPRLRLRLALRPRDGLRLALPLTRISPI